MAQSVPQHREAVAKELAEELDCEIDSGGMWWTGEGEPIEDRLSKALISLRCERDTALAERDRAVASMTDLQHTVNVYVVDNSRWGRRAETAEAERDELREALEGEIQWLTGVGGMTFVGVASPRDRIDTLRLALHDKEQG